MAAIICAAFLVTEQSMFSFSICAKHIGDTASN